MVVFTVHYCKIASAFGWPFFLVNFVMSESLSKWLAELNIHLSIALTLSSPFKSKMLKGEFTYVPLILI